MIRADPPSVVLRVPTWTLLGPFQVTDPDGLHALIRRGRAGDAEAVAAILERVRRAPRMAWPAIASGVVVRVPGHLPGPPNPLITAAAELISAVGGWHLSRDALWRRSSAPEAKTALRRDREDEAATLGWTSPREGRVVVLVDDVVRTGATLNACAEAIRVAGDGRPVVAIALAEAVAPAGSLNLPHHVEPA